MTHEIYWVGKFFPSLGRGVGVNGWGVDVVWESCSRREQCELKELQTLGLPKPSWDEEGGRTLPQAVKAVRQHANGSELIHHLMCVVQRCDTAHGASLLQDLARGRQHTQGWRED